MRGIKEARKFKKDKKRIERSGRYSQAIESRLLPAVIALANDEPLDASYYDHALTEDMQGRRECHILFDLLLVYRKIGDDIKKVRILSAIISKSHM